jgi:hypothetical protein
MQIDVSNNAPKIIDLKGEVITYIDGKPTKMHPKRDAVLDMLDTLAKFEKDKQYPRKPTESSLVKRNLEYVKKHNAIPKTELRGIYNAIHWVWNERC